jgi:hypothetical protein
VFFVIPSAGIIPDDSKFARQQERMETVNTILLIEPPFHRLYNSEASLNKLPLSLSYLAGAIVLRKPNWQPVIYNSDFSPHDAPLDYKYLAGPGFEKFRNAINEPNLPIWDEIRNVIKKFDPSVVGITVK